MGQLRRQSRSERHFGKIAQLLGMSESKIKDKIKSGSSSNLSEENAKKVLDYLRTI
jgi:hypothetical protein